MNYPENHLLATALGPIWKQIGIRPYHGIAFPISALCSENSLGIGEFLDLLPMIDWVSALGMDILQILPINDTGEDPSPYNQISSLALNPIYIRLSELPDILLQSDPHFKALKELTRSKRVSFQEVKKLKMAILLNYYKKHSSEFRKSAPYRMFFEENPWLTEYGLYKILRKNLPLAKIRNLSEMELFTYIKEYDGEIHFHAFLQFHAFDQMKLVKNYADQKKVFIKGDIPILVSPDSMDYWFYQELFLQGYVAGSPPDFYNAQGQKWNFPLFNWEALEKTHYFWWKQRLTKAEQFFHLYRIDHVVGFFRIWGIEPNKESKEGSFLPSNRFLWPILGKEHLKKIIKLSSLLPLAEDLGTIPPEVYPILKELGICGTKVIRWERNWEEDGSFIPLKTYEPISLTTISTHDSETVGEWWQKFPEDAKAYTAMQGWDYTPNFTPLLREKMLKDAHHTPSLFHINLLQEYLGYFNELSHPSFEEERINIPGTLREENWTYRFVPTVEEILNHAELAFFMKSLL